ncbi:MAG: hypothetical protein M3Z06_14135 [Actinomycetota bacterium]|nr:hypothetical protein [Actinomycetota bacterium]
MRSTVPPGTTVITLRSPSALARHDVERFDFAFTPIYRQLGRWFGVTPRTAWAEVSDDALDVRFGPWRVRSGLLNISKVEITGPYAVTKTAGPARLGLDRGLALATNSDKGLLVTFHKPVPGVEPLGLLRHPDLTITVADPEALAAELRARGATSRAQ